MKIEVANFHIKNDDNESPTWTIHEYILIRYVVINSVEKDVEAII